MVRNLFVAFLALYLFPGCSTQDVVRQLPPSRAYVDQRFDDVDEKIEDTWDAAYDASTEAKANGADDGAAARAGIAAGRDAGKVDLPQREDWLGNFWLWGSGAFLALYRLLVGRFPLLGGLSELIKGVAPAQLAKKPAAKRRVS